MEPIYHVALGTDWDEAQRSGEYRHPSLENEGFIHFSFERQLKTVADLFFKDMGGLVLLKVDPSRLKAELRVDDVPEMADQFPHLYGPLNCDAVVEAKEFKASD